MKRAMPWGDEPVDIISSDESSDADGNSEIKEGLSSFTVEQPFKELSPSALLMKKAEMYQEYMKQVPVPIHRGSIIPFTTWMGLGRSIKQLYGQPLHYLTNILLKKWDQGRFGSEDEDRPLDIVVHPCKAEAAVWLVEEVHRHTSSPQHLAKLWQVDPTYHVFVDSVFPAVKQQ